MSRLFNLQYLEAPSSGRCLPLARLSLRSLTVWREHSCSARHRWPGQNWLSPPGICYQFPPCTRV